MPTARETIEQLIRLKIDLIPIRPGGKIPLHANWNVPVERKVSHVINSFTRSPDTLSLPVDQFTREHANFGVLNATSGIVTLDCDSPLAGKALQAACDALGGDLNLLYPETSWNSARGQKAMYRRPAKLAAGRTMFKVYRGDGKFDVIFELRGTGQDVLPPSWREDAQVRLAWFHEPPTKIPPMPKWLVQLYAELNAGKGGIGFDAMCKALELNESQRTRTYSTSQSLNGYPDRLIAFPSERAYVNGKYKVEELLDMFGYQRDGKRWKPPGSHHAAGIIAPRRGNSENWLCEHEGDVLAGVFDAWRVMVECAFDGDVMAAAESTRIEQQSALAAVRNEEQVEEQRSTPKDQREKRNKPKNGTTTQSVLREQVGKADDQQHQPEGQAVAVQAAAVLDDPAPAADEPAAQRKQKQAKPQPETKRRKTVHDDFLTTRHEAIKPILYGNLVLTPGCHLLSAMPKAGKSTLLTAMALVAATGKSISGLRIDQPVSVLYCALDENVRQNLQPRIQRLAARKDLPGKTLLANLHLITSADELFDWARAEGIDCIAPLDIETQPDEALDEDELKSWQTLVRPKFNPHTRALYHYLRTNRIQFAAVDLITSMRAKAERMQSVYERDLEEFMAFNAIAVAAGCAMVGAHHMNKAAAGVLSVNGNALAKVSGTNAISGAMQSIISMSHVSLPHTDHQTLYDIEPRGVKVAIEQTSRDSQGMDATAFSLVASRVDGFAEDEPALEWTPMGPAEDVLAKYDEKEFIRQFLYGKPPAEFTSAAEIYQAAVTAGISNSRSADSFRKLPQRMVRAGHLESRRGSPSSAVPPGFRLTASMRARIKARNDAMGY